jgi:haloalkane dehalogenase
MPAESKFVEVGGLRLHYREQGSGHPALLLHGWPTSSFLWRNVIGHLGPQSRAIALDLPGFGQSDKPLDASYSFRFYARILDEFLAALEIESTDLVVHDLGGPIGLYWAARAPERIRRLALLNTLVYPKPSWAVVLFVSLCKAPGFRSLLASPRGLRFAMRIGMTHRDRLTDELLEEVQAPFRSRDERRALLKAGTSLHPKGFEEIASALPSFTGPVLLAYGERDRILPDVAKTMSRVKADLPQAELRPLAGCGHFLQEDCPEEVGTVLAEFLA